MSYSILTTNFRNHIDLIDRLYIFLQEKFPLEDFTIFTDEVVFGLPKFSMLTTFYMIAYKGTVVFLSLEDYLDYNHMTCGQKIVYIPNDEMHLIDRSMTKDFSIITEIENQLQWVNNYGL